MAITVIPERYRSGLVRIQKMPEQVFAELLSALDHSPIVARFSLLSSRLASDVKALDKNTIDDVLRSVLSLITSVAESGISADKVASELVDAMRVSGREDLRVPPEQEETFRNRIRVLLTIPSLNMSAKACSVRTDYPNVFCDAKILSDIRPVFDKPSDKPIGSVINHTLSIEYHVNGTHRRFHLTLDADDLSKLKRIFERAEIKAVSLKTYLKDSAMPDLDLS